MTEQLIVVRHGETVHNVAGIAQGWGDSELSEAGRRQVTGLARRVAAMSPDAIFSSPLQRALSTAEEIKRLTGLPIRVIDELREMNYGVWEGQRFMEVRHTDAENYHRWIDEVAFPCPNGESHQDVLERLGRAFAGILAAPHLAFGHPLPADAGRGAPDVDPGARGGSVPKRPVVVTHGTAIRIAATGLMQLPLSAVRNFAQDNAAFNVFLRRGERWVLKVWNDTSHCG